MSFEIEDKLSLILSMSGSMSSPSGPNGFVAVVGLVRGGVPRPCFRPLPGVLVKSGASFRPRARVFIPGGSPGAAGGRVAGGSSSDRRDGEPSEPEDIFRLVP